MFAKMVSWMYLQHTIHIAIHHRRVSMAATRNRGR